MPPVFLSRLLFILLLLFTLLLPGCDSSPSYVQDPAGCLSIAQQGRLQEFQRLLHVEQDVEFLLVILDQATSDLDQTALELFEQNRLGSKTAGARGLLLVVDPINQQARIEVGYDLEGLFPDGFIAGLEYDQMLPFFQQHRIGDGVEALTELLVTRLFNQEDGDVAAVSGQAYLSGGGGARISTAGEVAPGLSAEPDRYLPQPTPLATLDVYRQALLDRSKDPELEIYTSETRQFLRKWLVTDAQQQNALRELERVFSSAEVLIEQELAVIRFPLADRQASPYFLLLSTDGWQLDFATMSKTIGFNHRNQWHFRDRQHPYMFAFSDWRFDQHGFPHTP